MVARILLTVALGAALTQANPILPAILARQGPQSCRNQSCEIATVAGSTGAQVYPYATYPTGDTQDGDCCIIRYFPAAKAAIYAERPGLQTYCQFTGGDAPKDQNPPGVSTVAVPATATHKKRQTQATAPCKPNILMFAKGTFETGDFGNTLGPMFQSGLDANKWEVIGSEYDNGLGNDYCLGLPGGVTFRGQLNQVVTQCPNSYIFMSGYSQGAMVVRNAIARAPAAQVAKIKGVVNFGDPFCGAAIGQYSGPINVFCDPNDGVCNGQFQISAAHLSYSGDVALAIAILNAAAKK